MTQSCKCASGIMTQSCKCASGIMGLGGRFFLSSVLCSLCVLSFTVTLPCPWSPVPIERELPKSSLAHLPLLQNLSVGFPRPLRSFGSCSEPPSLWLCLARGAQLCQGTRIQMCTAWISTTATVVKSQGFFVHWKECLGEEGLATPRRDTFLRGSMLLGFRKVGRLG